MYNENNHALNFVRFPSDIYASYIIHSDGTIFKYLKTQENKHRASFLKNFPALKAWNPQEFYYWHREVETLSYSRYGWVHPYHLKYLGCKD